jgi:serine phosphatase RsbU (regulator of sigma subunit)
VTEAYNPDGKEYEEFRLQEFLFRTRHQPAGVICSDLMEKLYRWMDGSPEHDDITVVVARRDD